MVKSDIIKIIVKFWGLTPGIWPYIGIHKMMHLITALKISRSASMLSKSQNSSNIIQGWRFVFEYTVSCVVSVSQPAVSRRASASFHSMYNNDNPFSISMCLFQLTCLKNSRQYIDYFCFYHTYLSISLETFECTVVLVKCDSIFDASIKVHIFNSMKLARPESLLIKSIVDNLSIKSI